VTRRLPPQFDVVQAAALQPISFVTLTRLTNSVSRNWVNLVQVGSVAESDVDDCLVTG